MPKHSNTETCTLWFCKETHYGRGLCARHYQNWLRNQDPLTSKAKDLRKVLVRVNELLEVIKVFIDPALTYENIVLNERVIAVCCRYCDVIKEGGDPFEAKDHGENCIVPKACEIVANSISHPPTNDFSYEIDLTIGLDGHGESSEVQPEQI